jgi:hypothetical protein
MRAEDECRRLRGEIADLRAGAEPELARRNAELAEALDREQERHFGTSELGEDGREQVAEREAIADAVDGLETALRRFNVGELPTRIGIPARIEAVVGLIARIKEVFDEQAMSLARIAGSLPKRT